jgi:hemerythrin-like domain-containing protein
MSDEDVITILEHDHREVEEMFKELESLSGKTSDDAVERRQELVRDVTLELARHSVAEEVIVYPRVASKISEDEVEHAREEHAEAEESLAKLEKLDPGSPDFEKELGTLMEEIRHHIEDEEQGMFAKMRENLSADELRTMGTAVKAFKKVAPTRPHPNVHNDALSRLAAGPVASVLDRLRDLARS